MKFPWKVSEPDPNQEIFARNKYVEFKKFAESCHWLRLNEVLETAEDYPAKSYLTQNGTMVIISIDSEGCKVDNRRCCEIINLQINNGQEIIERLTGG